MRSGARPKCDPVFSPPASRHGTALLLWLEAFITALLPTYLSSGVWFILLGPYLCSDSIEEEVFVYIFSPCKRRLNLTEIQKVFALAVIGRGFRAASALISASDSSFSYRGLRRAHGTVVYLLFVS